MGQDEKETHRQLTGLLSDISVPELPYGEAEDRYVIFSDLHMGNGGPADDIRDNAQILCSALDYYCGDHTLILLGDIEELWQFDLPDIRREYGSSIYRGMVKFGGNIYRVFGNHDRDWGTFGADSANDPVRASSISEAIKLVDDTGETKVLLVHGHQGSTESDKWSFLSRTGVYLYRLIEPLFKIDRLKSATKSIVVGNYEQIMYSWALKSRVLLVCGHSHRAMFASRSYADKLDEQLIELQSEILRNRKKEERVKELLKELEVVRKKLTEERLKNRAIDPCGQETPPKPCYFNSGCGLYSNGITCIEIEGRTIRLVKWNKGRESGDQREVFAGCEGEISDFLEQMSNC